MRRSFFIVLLVILVSPLLLFGSGFTRVPNSTLAQKIASCFQRLRSSSLLERHAGALRVHAETTVPGEGGASLLWSDLQQIVAGTRKVATDGFELNSLGSDRRDRARVEMTA